MERNRTPNPEFVEWMKHRIRLAGEEIIKRADLMTFEGFDAMTDFNIFVYIPTLKDFGEIWPNLTFYARCGDATMVDELKSGFFNPYPPKQFISADEESGKEISKTGEEKTDESSV